MHSKADAEAHRGRSEIASGARGEAQPGHSEAPAGGVSEPYLHATAEPTGSAPHRDEVGGDDEVKPVVAGSQGPELGAGAHSAGLRGGESPDAHVAAHVLHA